MNASNPRRFTSRVGAFALAALMLTSVSQVWATPQDHVSPDRDAPWSNCTLCHGQDLLGISGITPSCMSCHSDFSPPDPPAPGHHNGDRQDPLANCAFCHGADLTGGIGTSCFTCHDVLWDGGGGENLPPNVVSGGPYQGMPDVPVEFDASGTIDPDGDSLIYLWSFGDGSPPQFPSQSPLISHTYEAVGSYTAVLTVTDGINDPVMVDVDVEISLSVNLPPTAVAGGPYAGTAGQAVQFDGSGSSDPEGDSLTYSWDFGDGTAPTTPSSAATATHTYASNGSYTAMLTVNDGFNAPQFASAAVEIANLPPVVLAGGPYTGTAEQAVQFDGSGSFDPDGDPLTYSWDFGDGTAPTGTSSTATATHTYLSSGTYTVVLTVSDGINSPESDSTTVQINDPPIEPPIPPGTGDDWQVMLPFLFGELTVSFEEFAGILLVHTTPLGGEPSFGIGMEFDGLIFWMDITGSLFYGNLDQTDGTGWGLVFGYQGGASSVWFAERL